MSCTSVQVVEHCVCEVLFLHIKFIIVFQGNLCGSLSSLKAHELGAEVIKDAVERSKVSVDDVDEVILGQVLTAGIFFEIFDRFQYRTVKYE